MRRKSALLALVGTFAMAGIAPASMGNPSPPTNGGNGAGQSGECTGANADRPSSCQSQAGPGNQP